MNQEPGPRGDEVGVLECGHGFFAGYGVFWHEAGAAYRSDGCGDCDLAADLPHDAGVGVEAAYFGFDFEGLFADG